MIGDKGDNDPDAEDEKQEEDAAVEEGSEKAQSEAVPGGDEEDQAAEEVLHHTGLPDNEATRFKDINDEATSVESV